MVCREVAHVEAVRNDTDGLCEFECGCDAM